MALPILPLLAVGGIGFLVLQSTKKQKTVSLTKGMPVLTGPTDYGTFLVDGVRWFRPGVIEWILSSTNWYKSIPDMSIENITGVKLNFAGGAPVETPDRAFNFAFAGQKYGFSILGRKTMFDKNQKRLPNQTLFWTPEASRLIAVDPQFVGLFANANPSSEWAVLVGPHMLDKYEKMSTEEIVCDLTGFNFVGQSCLGEA